MASSSSLQVMLRPDPLSLRGTTEDATLPDNIISITASWVCVDSVVVVLTVPHLLAHMNGGSDPSARQAIQAAQQQEDGTVRVAIADYLARRWTAQTKLSSSQRRRWSLERLDQRTERRRRRRRPVDAPYMLERTDLSLTCEGHCHWSLRLLLWEASGPSALSSSSHPLAEDLVTTTNRVHTLWTAFLATTSMTALARHVATAVAQSQLRHALEAAQAIAFLANGSILPRKSGASAAPMASPPALPLQAPVSNVLRGSLTIDMGSLLPYWQVPGAALTPDEPADTATTTATTTTTTVTLHGLVIPAGLTLICGGGYHGKSTLLRAVAAGVYTKIPGDGRECCVTRTDALTVRAEDGRSVQNCNISAFISNLPTLPGSTTAVDTSHFSTREASGSTSQAANVVEALELGCRCLLVDEDVSAANFMARDGRMRALVMDESITPLLYRVNGLYQSLGVSSIVVVGGVGDWLDVPDHVLLLDKYACSDATAKAKSVSRQFSHGHVQYAGRGLVHRLPWPSTGSPVPRRPSDDICQAYAPRHVTLLDGGHGLALVKATAHGMDEREEDDDNDNEEGWIDLSRCEQLLGRQPQVYGCGLAVRQVLRLAQEHPQRGLAALLETWDRQCQEVGFGRAVPTDEATWSSTVATLGAALRPRPLEVGQALCRLRGIVLEDLPVEEDPVEVAAMAEAERKKEELLDIWNNRRKR
jgi:hypothetical protein